MAEQPAPPMVAATWRAEDFAALETYLSPIWVDIFEGARPPVLVDARGYEMVAYQGVTGNPLMAVALEAFYGSGQRSLNDEIPRQQRDLAGAAGEARMLIDTILAAVIVAPPYAPRARCGDGMQPPAGHLWYGSFTADQRRALADFFYLGAEALKSVRRVAGPDDRPDRDGPGLRSAAVEHPDPARPGLSPVVAGRGDGVPAERAGDAAGAAPADHERARDGAPEPRAL